MAAAIPLMIGAGTGMQVIGALQQGRAAQNAAQYNASMMDQAATVERQQASVREDAQRQQARLLLGEQRAAFAQSGGGMGGSAGDVMQQSAINAELDALTMRYEGELRARGLNAQAEGERYSGRTAKQNSYFSAAGSILSGAAMAYGMKPASGAAVGGGVKTP